MKKIALILSFVMLFAVVMVGCADNRPDAEKIVGKWVSEIDMTKQMNDDLGSSGLDIDIDSFKFNIILDYKSDGTFTSEADADSVASAFEAIKPIMKDAMKGMLGDLISEEELNKMIDEEFTIDSFEEQFKTEGKYKLEDGKIFTAQGDQEFNEDDYVEYKFEGKNLIFTGSHSEDDPLPYPITLIRK